MLGLAKLGIKAARAALKKRKLKKLKKKSKVTPKSGATPVGRNQKNNQRKVVKQTGGDPKKLFRGKRKNKRNTGVGDDALPAIKARKNLAQKRKKQVDVALTGTSIAGLTGLGIAALNKIDKDIKKEIRYRQSPEYKKLVEKRRKQNEE